MIKRRFVPAERTVTIAAFVPAAAIVRIIFCMTTETCDRCVAERIVRVTVQARRLLVPADQLKTGQVVIEFDIEPVIGRVTVTTLCPHRIGVRVVLLVAGEAVARRVTVANIRRVTICALPVRVMSDQLKIGLVVVEVALVETNDIGVPAFVVRVTVCTGRPARASILAVKPGLCVDIACDLFVTIEAQRALLAAFEAQMTVGALFLVFGVCLYYLTRHDQRLELRIRRGREEQCQGHH